MPDQKQSQFVTQADFIASDLVTGTRGGQNVNFSYLAIYNALNAGVSFTTIGNSLGVPTLVQPTAGVNQFRNIEDGPGILAAVSAESGIKISANFTQGSVGSQIINNLSTDATNFRTINAGAGISVAVSGDTIQIAAVNATVASKTVVIAQESDFPTAADGVITFADNTDYFIVQDVSTNSRFATNNINNVRASSSQMVTLTYTGTGAMLTGVNSNLKVINIAINAPNGTIFSMTSPAGTGKTLLIESKVISCQSIGTINGNLLTRFSSVAFESLILGGISFAGANKTLIIDAGSAHITAGAFIDLGTATFDTLTVTRGNLIESAAGTFFLKGAANSANINTNGLGTVINNNVFGSATSLSGITAGDASWNFRSNNTISDTRPDTLMSFLTPTTTTLSAGTPALINGTWTQETASQFTTTAAGRVTYIGEPAATLPVTASVIMEPTASTNKVINIYLAKGGVVVANTKVKSTISAAIAETALIVWQVTFVQNDYYEVWVESVDGTNVTVNNAHFRVN